MTDGVDVPTAHHQSIDRLGDGLVATAWAQDGVIEAVELGTAGSPFVLAVQWHPEAEHRPAADRGSCRRGVRGRLA